MVKKQQIEEIEQLIYDYVDSKQPKGVYLFGSRINEVAKPFVHNKGLSEALYNAGYRKIPKGSFICSGSVTNLDVEVCNNCGMQQAEELFERDKEIERLQKENEASKRVDNRVAFCKAYNQIRAENKRLKAKNKQLQEQLNSANAGNVNCSGCEAVETNAVKEFAEKVKKCSYCDNVFMDGKWHRYVFVDDIDKLLKEYEK